MSIQTNIISASLFRGMDANLTGSLITPSITGSLYGTASYAETLGGLTSASYVRKDLTDSDTQDINGSLKLTGDIIAENYIISSSILYVTTSFSSGSTRWGDSSTDTHQVTGSLFVTGSEYISDSLNVNNNLQLSNTSIIKIGYETPTTGYKRKSFIIPSVGEHYSGFSLRWGSTTYGTQTGPELQFVDSNARINFYTNRNNLKASFYLGNYSNNSIQGLLIQGGITDYNNQNEIAEQIINPQQGRLVITGSTFTGQMSGDIPYVSIKPTYSQSYGGTANTDLLINRYEIAVGSGSQYLIDLQNTSISKFNVSNSGIAYFANNVGIGTITPSMSLDVSGSGRFTSALTSSTALISGSGVSRLIVIGSGSTSPLFTVQGSQGELFSINDNLSGSLFSVSDISGLPILEVFSDDTIIMGDYTAPSLYTTAKYTTTNSGSFTIYQNIPTASYDAAYFDYFISSGSNKRAGQIVAVRNNTSMSVSEITTADFGDTSDIQLTVIVSGSNMALTGSAPTTSPWVIKSIIKAV